MTLNEDDKCYICKRELAEGEGEKFYPYQIPEYGDWPVMVCPECETGKKHQDNVELTDINHRAQDSHDEWCADNDL